MSKVSKEEEKQLRISPNMHPVPTENSRRSANIPIIGYIAFVLILIVGLVGTAKTMGWYGTSGKITSDGQAITLNANSSGADLKGWMTVDSFIKAFSITKKDFEKEFNVATGLSATATLGELGEITSEAVSVEILRVWVDAGHKLGTNVAPGATTPPSSSSSPSPVASSSPSGSPTGTPSNTDSTGAFLIKGRTTIQEVLDATKVSKAEFYAEFKLPNSIPTSTALTEIKTTFPDFEVSLVQDWYNAR